MNWQRGYIRKFYFRLSASMDPIGWNSNLVIPLKHIIFTTPFIADGSGLCAFWTDKSGVDFIQNAGGSL